MQDLNLETSASVLSEVSPPFVVEIKLLTKDSFQYNFISPAMFLRSEAASVLDNPADRIFTSSWLLRACNTGTAQADTA